MARSLRRSASASAAMATNSLPRWLISITDMPALCQLTSSHFAFSSTSTGIAAGPAPKLKRRVPGLMDDGFAIAGRGLCAAVAAWFLAVPAPVPVPVPVFAIVVVAVHDGLQPRQLLAGVE